MAGVRSDTEAGVAGADGAGSGARRRGGDGAGKDGGRTPVEAGAEPGSAATLTIEQLSAESGMTVRNIRSHQSRGLLPPPEVRARIGYYGAEHVARLALIADLQADGFNLAAIERLVNAPSGSAARLLGLRHALTMPLESETPDVLTAAELIERFGEVDAKDAERIAKLGLLVPLGDGRFEAPS